MPQDTQQAEDHVFNVLLLCLIMLIPILLLMCAGLLALEFNIDFLAAVLLIVGIISLFMFVSWWLSSISWVVKLLNKMAGQKLFVIRAK